MVQDSNKNSRKSFPQKHEKALDLKYFQKMPDPRLLVKLYMNPWNSKGLFI